MVPNAGQVSLFAFNTLLGRTDIVGGVRDRSDYGLFFTISDVPQAGNITRSVLTFFGTPSAHNGAGGPPRSFITLPTSCTGPQTISLTVTSWAGETAAAESTTPSGATGCDKLPFAPRITARTTAAKPGRPAGLSVKLTQAAGEANVASVGVTLPLALGVRLETLKNACPQEAFSADPAKCPPAARVGSTSAVTPLLAAPLAGDVYLEAHEPGKLPTLQAVLHGPGMQVGLTGSIDLSKGVTSTFNGVPELPVSEFSLNLDGGPGSPLASKTDMCAAPLTLTSSIAGHNAATVTGAAPVGVAGCGLAVVSKTVARKSALLTLRTPAAGRIRLSGKGIQMKTVSTSGAGTILARVRLSKSGVKSLLRKRSLAVRLSAAYVPVSGASAGGQPVHASKRLVHLRFRAR